MIYRSAQSRDAAKLAALSIEVWLHTYARNGISSVFADYVLESFTANHFRTLIANHDRQIIICEQEDNLLGYIALDFKTPVPKILNIPANAVEISTLYVRLHHAGRGIGQALIEQARHAVSARQISHIWLSVLHNNQRALHFYQQQGMLRQGSIWFELPGERHENYVMIQSV